MFWVVDLLPVCVASWVDCTGSMTSVLGGRSLTCLCWLLGGVYRGSSVLGSRSLTCFCWLLGGVYGVTSVLGGRSLTCFCWLLGGLYGQSD